MAESQNEVELLEEKAQEAELLKSTPTDEVRSSIIEKYGLDEEANSELIEQLVESETESGKRLSTAIKQKISWREKATKPAPMEQEPAETPQPVIQPKGEDFEKILDQRLNEKLAERDLGSLEVSDDLKGELKTYAKAGGLTLKQAMDSPYFNYLKEQETAKAKIEDASIGGKRKSPSRQEFTDEVPVVDMSTESGRNELKDWEKFQKGK